MVRLLSGLLLAVGMSGAAWAADIEVSDAVARATPPGAPVAGVYLTIRNHADADDRLLRAESPVAQRVELHDHVMADGVARMTPVPAVPLPARQAVTFQPGGLHVMLMGLDKPLVAGESFPLTLVFERGGEVPVTVAVQPMTAVMPHGNGGHAPHGHMQH